MHNHTSVDERANARRDAARLDPVLDPDRDAPLAPSVDLDFDPPPDDSCDAPQPAPLHGRGTPDNPANRFDRLHYHPVPFHDDPDDDFGDDLRAGDGDRAGSASPPPVPRGPKTLYLRDPTRKLITHNRSPDVPFDASINPYRGCEHGCIYCYARPGHEFLGFSAGLDFETRILIKDDAPQRLREELSHPKWRPQTIGISGVTDPYQPIERRTRLTRRCLEVLAEFRNPVGLITKSALVRRDIDILTDLASDGAVAVTVSITTLDVALHRVMEPRASSPKNRLEAIRALSEAGIPVGVNVAPVIPGLNCHEIPAIVQAAADAGARTAGHILLRLPHAVAELFAAWLRTHQPHRANKVLGRLRAMHGGALNDPRFGHRMRGSGVYAQQIHDLFDLSCRRSGLSRPRTEPSAAAFRRPPAPQLELF